MKKETTPQLKDLNKMSKKDLTWWYDWAKNEVGEFTKFMLDIKTEIKSRKKHSGKK